MRGEGGRGAQLPPTGLLLLCNRQSTLVNFVCCLNCRLQQIEANLRLAEACTAGRVCSLFRFRNDPAEESRSCVARARGDRRDIEDGRLLDRYGSADLSGPAARAASGHMAAALPASVMNSRRLTPDMVCAACSGFLPFSLARRDRPVLGTNL